MEKQRQVRFLVGGGTIEEYAASLEQGKSEPAAEDVAPEANADAEDERE